MIRFQDLALVRRKVRQDDPSDLGRATTELAREAIDDGRADDAKELIEYTIAEGKPLHDLLCDWLWDMLSQVARRFGEPAMFEVLKSTQDGWMMKRTWKGFLKLSVKERVDLTAEILRSHRGGPKQDGELTVLEDEQRYTIVMDPCGSGGRMRRGDPVDGTPSRLGPPYSFGATKEAYPWSWGKKGVPYYCLHCAVNEIVPIELGGHPLWVTAYDDDAAAPCAWHFYKRADDIPDVYYERLGRKKPAPGEGRY